MKVKILRDTVAGRKPFFVDDVLDLPDREAIELIAMKKAEVVPISKVAESGRGDHAPTEKAEEEDQPLETADMKPAGIETSVKRGKRKE